MQVIFFKVYLWDSKREIVREREKDRERMKEKDKAEGENEWV